MSDGTSTDGRPRARLLAGSVALVAGMAAMFGMLLTDAGSGPLAVVLSLASVALLVAGTVSIGTTGPGAVT